MCSLFSPSSRLATLGQGRSGGLRLDPFLPVPRAKISHDCCHSPLPVGEGGGERERQILEVYRIILCSRNLFLWEKIFLLVFSSVYSYSTSILWVLNNGDSDGWNRSFCWLGRLTIETGGLGTYSLSPFTSSAEFRPPLHVVVPTTLPTELRPLTPTYFTTCPDRPASSEVIGCKLGVQFTRPPSTMLSSVSSGDFAHLRIPGYFAHLLQHLKMKENDNSENSMIKNNPSLV